MKEKLLILIKQCRNQSDFARKIKVEPHTVTYWLQEKREPRIANIISICNKFNVSADWLLGLEKE